MEQEKFELFKSVDELTARLARSYQVRSFSLPLLSIANFFFV
jgi:hypothetical protein